MKVLQIILAIVLPPLGVFLKAGAGKDLVINIILTILGYLPGVGSRPLGRSHQARQELTFVRAYRAVTIARIFNIWNPAWFGFIGKHLPIKYGNDGIGAPKLGVAPPPFL